MIVVICGDRNWTDRKEIERVLGKLPSDTCIVEGGASGADSIARDVALKLGMEVTTVPAQWDRYGAAAGPRRNTRMLNKKPKIVIAFHNDLKKSKGTVDTIRKARKRKIPVILIGQK